MIFIKRLAKVFLVMLISTIGYAQTIKIDVVDIETKYFVIPYTTASDAQKLDIYHPNKGKRPFPVILHIHGGAFKMGDKQDEQLTPMLQGLKRGYADVSINYLSEEAIWPVQIYDCKAAVRWTRGNAREYNLRPEKIVAWGSSAGGHLSAMLGTSNDIKSLEDLKLGNADRSSSAQAVIDWFGPTDFLRMDEQLKESGVEDPLPHSVPDSPESKLIGNNLKGAIGLVKETNPETYISAIQHGLEDNLVPSALSKFGIACAKNREKCSVMKKYPFSYSRQQVMGAKLSKQMKTSIRYSGSLINF